MKAHRHSTAAAAAALALVALLHSAPAGAQKTIQRVEQTHAGYRIIKATTPSGRTQAITIPSAGRMLIEFQDEARGLRTPRLGNLLYVLTEPARFPAATVDSLLAGLAELAVRAAEPAVRTAAAHRLVIAGSRGIAHPMPGTVARMRRVYSRSDDPAVQRAILRSLPRAAETDEALKFLRSIALQPPHAQDFPGAAHEAIGILLLGMGAAGCAIVRELHEQQLIQDPDERTNVALLAARQPCLRD